MGLSPCSDLQTPGMRAMGQSTPIRLRPELPYDCDRPLQWDEIAALVDIRPDGSWRMTDLAKERFEQHQTQGWRGEEIADAGKKKAPEGEG
jgi:hypothetical protein